MRWAWRRLLDWVCSKVGLCLRFDGDLMAPSGDEPWWPAPAAEKEVRGRALATYLLEDGGDGWPVEDIYGLLVADGWAWNGRHWVAADASAKDG